MSSTLNIAKLTGLTLIGLLAALPASARAQATPGGGSSLSPEQKLELALKKIEAEEFREAELLIGEVSVEKPTLERIKLVRGLYYYAVQRYTEAMADLETYNGTPEARSEYRGFATVGDLYLRSRMWRSAIFPLEKAKDIAPIKENGKPVRADILLNLASAHLGLQNHKTAIKVAKEARDSAPDVADVHLRLAEISASSNDYETSVGAVEKAILLFTGDLRDDAFNRTAHDKLRSCYGILSGLYQYQLKRDAENAEYYSKYSLMLQQLAEIDRRRMLLDSLQLARQAIERSPKRVDYKISLIKLEYELGGIKDSKDLLDDILQQDPKNAEALEWKQKFEESPPRPRLS